MVVANACGAVCKPGETKCSGAMQQTCSAQGKWDTGKVVEGECNAICTPGAMMCADTTPQVCSSQGKWESRPIVARMCNAECTPNAKLECDTTHKRPSCDSRGRIVPGQLKVADCGVECLPSSESQCDGKFERTCNSQYKWVKATVVRKDKCGVDCNPGEGGCELRGQDCSGPSCSISGTGGNEQIVAFKCGPMGEHQITNYCAALDCNEGSAGQPEDPRIPQCKGTLSGAGGVCSWVGHPNGCLP
jgi:hypothetical protein